MSVNNNWALNLDHCLSKATDDQVDLKETVTKKTSHFSALPLFYAIIGLSVQPLSENRYKCYIRVKSYFVILVIDQ